MDYLFSDVDRDIRSRAAEFTDKHLVPMEEPTEKRGGHWTWEETQHIRDAAVDYAWSGGLLIAGFIATVLLGRIGNASAARR